MRKKIMWLIKGLGVGGAEQLLASTVPHLDRSQFCYELAYILPRENALAGYFNANQIPTFCLGATGKWDIRVIPKLAQLLRDREVDILDCHLPYSGVVGRIAGRLAKIKHIIYTEHDLGVQRTVAGLHFLSFLANIITYPLNDLIVTVSQYTYRDVRRYNIWHTPMMLVYNGVDLKRLYTHHSDTSGIRLKLGIPANNMVVGHVATMRREKKQDDLLKAAREVLKTFPQVTFVIVGRGPLEQELKQLAGHLGIQNNVVFTGFVADLYEVMETFDIFVMSSLHEGFGISLLEAMALGKPSVVTRVGGMTEVVEDKVSGLMAEPRAPEDLAQKILTLLTNDDLRKTMGQAAQRRSERFDIRKRVTAMEDIYRNLLSVKEDEG
jgi:glycosyltransferase involved in cell wall biosynthesis